MFQTVTNHNSFIIPKYGRHNFASRQNDAKTFLEVNLCVSRPLFAFYIWGRSTEARSHPVRYHDKNLSELLLNWFNERADALTPSAFRKHSLHSSCRHLFIIIFSLRIECTLLAETPTASAAIWTVSRRSLRTSLLTSTVSSSTEVDVRLQWLMDFGNYWSRIYFTVWMA